MKRILAISIFCAAIALPALGELTVQDIERIDAKIKESEARTKEYINTQIKGIDTQIESIAKGIDTQIESIDKRLSLITTLIVALIALIVLAVGIPQILIALRSRRDASLEKQIQTLTQDIETLKRKQIVRP